MELKDQLRAPTALHGGGEITLITELDIPW